MRSWLAVIACWVWIDCPRGYYWDGGRWRDHNWWQKNYYSRGGKYYRYDHKNKYKHHDRGNHYGHYKKHDRHDHHDRDDRHDHR